MSSGSELQTATEGSAVNAHAGLPPLSGRILLVVGACAAIGACERGSSAPPAPMSTPPASVAVGPIPGTPDAASGRAIENPLADDAVALQEGRRLFVAMNCSGCHGGRGGGGMGPSLRDELWIYGSDDARIFDSIAAGRANGMPAWGSRLPSQEIWKMVAYIQSMRTEREPQAP